MTTKITNIITEEILNPTFEMTRKYLKILEVKYEINLKMIKLNSKFSDLFFYLWKRLYIIKN